MVCETQQHLFNFISLSDCSRVWSGAFAWATSTAFGSVRGAEIWLVLYFAVYAWWTLTSYYHAKMSEWLCQSMVVLGFVFVFPIYLALWTAIIMQGVNIVNGLVIATLLIPVVIASSQSLSSATLYVVYLPWFLFCILFFLVYLPSYSFARLWDTTWGKMLFNCLIPIFDLFVLQVTALGEVTARSLMA